MRLLPCFSRILVASALTGACTPASDNARASRHVDRVLDGDTFESDTGERVRLLGIDAPERDEECYGEEAFAQLRDTIINLDVELEFDYVRTDAFARTLAYVYVDGEMINTEMLRLGAACVLTIAPNDRYARFFEAVEATAEGADQGLWNLCGGCDTPV